jgi:hypothetical protein
MAIGKVLFVRVPAEKHRLVSALGKQGEAGAETSRITYARRVFDSQDRRTEFIPFESISFDRNQIRSTIYLRLSPP